MRPSPIPFSLCLLLALTTARAEETPSTQPSRQAAPPATAPAGSAEDAQQVLDALLQPQRGTARPIPTADREAGSRTQTTPTGRIVTVSLKREGNLIVQRTVRLLKSETAEEWELHFEAENEDLQEPPMIALENSNLARMQQQQHIAGREIRFVVSGLITQYKGRNYLLIERARIVGDEPS